MSTSTSTTTTRRTAPALPAAREGRPPHRAPGVCPYHPPGRRHAPYHPPLTGDRRRAILRQIRDLALALYPGAGKVLLHTEPHSRCWTSAGYTLDFVVHDRRPAIQPGTVGAVAYRVLVETVRPTSDRLGYHGRHDPRTGRRLPRRRNTREQTRWRELRFVFAELAYWFAAFPVDDLAPADLEHFARLYDDPHAPNRVRAQLPAVRRLLRAAGVSLARS